MGDYDIPGVAGPFIFPMHGTQAVRLTDTFDEILPAGMAYWNNINHHAGRTVLYAFLGTTHGVRLWGVDKQTLRVERLESFRPGTGEGWYFSKVEDHILYLHDGPRLIRHDIVTHREEVAWDASAYGDELWQCHTSHDGRAHSGTIRQAGALVGCAAFSQGTTHLFGEGGQYDECQIDKSGQWLLTKYRVNSGADVENIVRDLHTGAAYELRDVDKALGHSDMGHGYMVGEENQSDPGGVIRRWALNPGGPVDAGVVHSSTWDPMTRYVSHCNAPQPWVLYTDNHALTKVYLDGRPPLVVCPTLWAGGGYESLPKANLDPLGEWALWTTPYQGAMTAFLVRIP